MSTSLQSSRKSRFVLVTVRIGFFMLPIIVPMRCAQEVIEGFMDFLSLFTWAGRKVHGYLGIAEAALIIVKDYGSLDLVDIDVKSPEARVKVKVLTR